MHSPLPTDSVELVIPSDCDAQTAADICAMLKAKIIECETPTKVSLELSDGPPTAFALQLFFSAELSVKRIAAFAGLGSNAQRLRSSESQRGAA